LAVRCLTADRNAFDAGRGQAVAQRRDVEPGVHSVARCGVGSLKGEMRGGRQAVTRAAEGDAGGGELAQVGPRHQRMSGQVSQQAVLSKYASRLGSGFFEPVPEAGFSVRTAS
jgi:hypothetical protein